MKPVLTNSIEIVQAEPLTMLRSIVQAIGADLAADLFLKLGGGTVYIPERPRPHSRLVSAIGQDAVAALNRYIGRGHVRVPLANAWIAHQLVARGMSRSDVGRRLRVSRSTLSSYLAKPKAAA